MQFSAIEFPTKSISRRMVFTETIRVRVQNYQKMNWSIQNWVTGFDEQLENAASDLEDMLDQKGLEIQQKLDELLIKKENFEFDTWPDIHSTLENITSFVESIENEFSEKIENIEANRKNLKFYRL